MADLLVLTPSSDGATGVLPALGLLSHRTRVVAPEPSAMLDALDADVLVIDARNDLSEARNNCRLVQVTGVKVPLLLVLREGGMSIVTAEWGADDVVLRRFPRRGRGPGEAPAGQGIVRGSPGNVF